MKINKNLFCMMYFFMIVLIVLVAVNSILHFYPFKTIDMIQPFKIVNDSRVITKGDIVFIQMNYLKHIDNPATTTKYIYGKSKIDDTVVISLGSTITATKQGKHTLISGTVLPDSIPCGEYKMVYLVVYELFGGFRKISKTFESESFQVVKCD